MDDQQETARWDDQLGEWSAVDETINACIELGETPEEAIHLAAEGAESTINEVAPAECHGLLHSVWVRCGENAPYAFGVRAGVGVNSTDDPQTLGDGEQHTIAATAEYEWKWCAPVENADNPPVEGVLVLHAFTETAKQTGWGVTLRGERVKQGRTAVIPNWNPMLLNNTEATEEQLGEIIKAVTRGKNISYCIEPTAQIGESSTQQIDVAMIAIPSESTLRIRMWKQVVVREATQVVNDAAKVVEELRKQHEVFTREASVT